MVCSSHLLSLVFHQWTAPQVSVREADNYKRARRPLLKRARTWFFFVFISVVFGDKERYGVHECRGEDTCPLHFSTLR